jgi:hypothetical protein
MDSQGVLCLPGAKVDAVKASKALLEQPAPSRGRCHAPDEMGHTPEIACRAVAGKGLEGDRYFLGRGSLSRWPGRGRQVTLIEYEALEGVRRERGIRLGGGLARRRLVTTGVEVVGRQGRQFWIGKALFRAACGAIVQTEGVVVKRANSISCRV